MPQALSELTPEAAQAPVRWGTASFEVHPTFAVLAMQVIRTWAQNDWALLTCMGNLMRADTGLVVASFRDVGHRSRDAALHAAAKERFNIDHYELFAAALSTTTVSRERRNAFVHHIWGTCDAVPDAVILADPSDLAAEVAEVLGPLPTRARRRGSSAGSNGSAHRDSSRYFAHDERDFLDAVADANRALKVVNLLQRMSLLNPPLYNVARFDAACEKLLGDPLIRRALERRRKKS